MQSDIGIMAIIAGVLGALAGVAEYIHPTAGFYPAGVALGVWASAAWLYLRTSETPFLP